MRWSHLFIPTLREGTSLLTRAGYFRGDTQLTLGRRTQAKIEAIIREEMARAGVQEMHWTDHESIIAIARGELRSHKVLPQVWHRIDEAYTFTPGRTTFDVYKRVITRCGLQPLDQTPAAPPRPDPEDDLSPEEFHTPGQKTIADIAAFTGLPETSQMKSLVMLVDGEPVLALLRGDHQLDEASLGDNVRTATADEIRQWFGASAGSLGPVGVTTLRIVADTALQGRRNMICGANKDDYHLRNVTPGEDFEAEFADLRQVGEGRPPRLVRASQPNLRLTVHDAAGKEAPLHVGRYRLNLRQLLDAIVDTHHDKDGLVLPRPLAPFTVVVTPVFIADAQQREAADSIYAACLELGLDPVLDDRDERPGVKFKDADLIGVPYRITLGKKTAQGIVEVAVRHTKAVTEVPVAAAAAWVREQEIQ